MSEKNNIFENDLLMRAILEGGQEEVPGRIWDAVADSLDKADADRRQKTVTLWWRRAGVSAAAMAAAVASVVVLTRPEPADFVPIASNGDMIAVVEPADETVDEETVVEEAAVAVQTSVAGLVAYVPERTVNIMPENMPVAEEIVETEATEPVMNEGPVEAKPERKGPSEVVAEKEKVYFPTVWEDDENETERIRTSVVVSGITGASGSQSNPSNGILKAPALITSPIETGIKDKNAKSEFGLPVSVGAGVKIDFTPRWSLGVGLNYTYLTRTFNGTYTHVNEAGAIDNLITSDIRNSQHFIGIPVNAYYNIVNNKHVNFYAYAGGAVEKCVYDKYLVLTNSIVHKEPVKGVQLSANIGFGAEFMIGQHIGLYLDPSLRYYFDCNQPKSIRTVQPLMLGFELGFRFRL